MAKFKLYQQIIQRVRRLGNEMTAMEIRKQPDTNVCPLWAFHIFY